jgi:hypothetical protein
MKTARLLLTRLDVEKIQRAYANRDGLCGTNKIPKKAKLPSILIEVGETEFPIAVIKA